MSYLRIGRSCKSEKKIFAYGTALNLAMEQNSSEEDIAALLKSIEITKEDAEFNGDNPPFGILSPDRMFFLQSAIKKNDPQQFFNKVLKVESNREILKKELTRLIFTYMICWDEDFKLNSLPLLIKYECNCNKKIEIGKFLFNVFNTYPDIAYNLQKKNPMLQNHRALASLYKNFHESYINMGILGLLPKGKKYGGFIKALFHIILWDLGSGNSEKLIGLFRMYYHSSITPHSKREKWFAKLGIAQSDCILWSKIFDEDFPQYTDMYKYFGQIS